MDVLIFFHFIYFTKRELYTIYVSFTFTNIFTNAIGGLLNYIPQKAVERQLILLS
jgi:hypothetical protein